MNRKATSPAVTPGSTIEDSMTIYVGAARAKSNTLCMNEIKVTFKMKNAQPGIWFLMISLQRVVRL